MATKLHPRDLHKSIARRADNIDRLVDLVQRRINDGDSALVKLVRELRSETSALALLAENLER